MKPGTARHTRLPDTFDGIRFTLGRMVKMIVEGRKDPMVIATARKIAAVSTSEKGDLGAAERTLLQLKGIHAWCRENFVFVNDPTNIELIQTPNRMLRELEIPPQLHEAVWKPVGEALGGKMPKPKMTGDADEAVTISLALAAAIGIDPLRIDLGGSDGTIYTAWGSALVDGQWHAIDILAPTFGKHQEVEALEHLDVVL